MSATVIYVVFLLLFLDSYYATVGDFIT